VTKCFVCLCKQFTKVAELSKFAVAVVSYAESEFELCQLRCL